MSPSQPIPPRESWKDVPAHPGYQASDFGRLRSQWRKRGRLSKRWRLLKPCPNEDGYLITNLRDVLGRRTRLVHQVILETFVGPRPPGMVCRHLDGNPANNRLCNLRWGTCAENAADTIHHGRTLPGRANPLAKLTEDQVIEIRRRRCNGELQRVIAADFGVSPSSVAYICRGDLWAHVPGWEESSRVPRSFAHMAGPRNTTPRKLTADDVRRIRERAAAGESQRTIAADYGIVQQTVHLAITRRTWAHVD